VLVEVEASQGAAVVGRVIEAGERATGLVGKRVLVGAVDPCGECEICRRGGAAVCPHATRREAIADRIAAAARWAVPLEDGLELPLPAAAAVAGDVALAYTLYARTGIGVREPVVICGASPIARFLIEILIAKAIAPIVLVDPAHAAWCAHLAAKQVATATDRDGIAARFAADGIGRPWRVIAASPAAAVTAAALAGPRATLTVLAPIPVLPGDLAAREVTIIGVAGAHPDLIVEVAAMCAKHEIDLVGGTSCSETADMRSIVRIATER